MPELFAARYGPARLADRALRWLERRTQSAADAAIGVNGYLRARLERAGARPGSVSVVRNGPLLDRRRRRPPGPALRAGAAALCCWAGKMGRQDRVDLLVEVIAALVEQRGRRDVRFVLLGDGECLDELRAQVVARGLDDCVGVPGLAARAGALHLPRHRRRRPGHLPAGRGVPGEGHGVHGVRPPGRRLRPARDRGPGRRRRGARATGRHQPLADALDALLDEPRAPGGSVGKDGAGSSTSCAGSGRPRPTSRRSTVPFRGVDETQRGARHGVPTDGSEHDRLRRRVIGAGPYGLAAAAHLRRAGVATHVLGDPMSFWRTMPPGHAAALEPDGHAASPSTTARSRWTATRPRPASSSTLPVPLDALPRLRHLGAARWSPPTSTAGACRRLRPGRAAGSCSPSTTATGSAARRVVVAGGIADFVAPARPSPAACRRSWSPTRRAPRPAAFRRPPGARGRRRAERAGVGGAAARGAAPRSRSSRAPTTSTGCTAAKYHRLLGRAAPLVYAPTDVGPMGLSRLVAVPGPLPPAAPPGARSRWPTARSARPAPPGCGRGCEASPFTSAPRCGRSTPR